MSWAITPQASLLSSAPAKDTSHSPPPSAASSASALGNVQLVDSVEITLVLRDAEARGVLPVTLPGPGPSWRGQLALRVEEAIEEALRRRGACPPGVGAATSLDESLADQLYRARLLELRGIVLGIPSLSGMASLGGVLDAEDSAVLRWWIDATRRAPVSLLLELSNATLAVYAPPRPLSELLNAAAPVSEREEGARALVPEVGASVAAMELSEPPPAVVERDGALAFEQPLDDPEGTEVTARQPLVAATQEPPAHVDAAERAPLPSQEAPAEAGPARAVARASGGSMETLGDITEAILQSLAEPRLEPEKEDALAAALADSEAPPPAAEPEKPKAQPLYPNARDDWRTWVAELSSARGAKPLAAIERMFVSSYVPLADAVLSGVADADAEALLQRWAKSFAHSYEEAFEALRVRGKRPTMVLDVPEIALRIGRLHGARSVQLLLVDAMRFDLGLRIEQRVRGLVGQQAALAERLLLWSALPSTTEVQLELIGRGAEALAEPERGQTFEVPVARGRAASSLRRVKTGHRELMKLDVVEARLAEPGPSEAVRLDALADETAKVLSDYLMKQPPRTLVLAFGDHGFLLDRLDEHTTRAARQGGASPEEVLVPAFAWLVGGMH